MVLSHCHPSIHQRNDCRRVFCFPYFRLRFEHCYESLESIPNPPNGQIRVGANGIDNSRIRAIY